MEGPIFGILRYSTARRIFNSLLGVSSGDETLRLMLGILLQTCLKQIRLLKVT